MIDPAKGDVRARSGRRAGRSRHARCSADAGQARFATVGPNAAVAVGVDGTVYALSAEKGKLAILRPQGQGFAKPEQVGLDLASKSAQVTAVGGHWVVFDSGTGKLFSDRLEQPEQLSVGDGEPGTPAYAALQQPGPRCRHGAHRGPVGSDQHPDRQGRAAWRWGQAQSGRPRPEAAAHGSPCVSARASTRRGPERVGRSTGATVARPVTPPPSSSRRRTRACAPTASSCGSTAASSCSTTSTRATCGDVDRGQIKIDDWNSLIPPPQTDDKNKKKDEKPRRRRGEPHAPEGAARLAAGSPRPHLDPARARQRLRLAGLHPRHLSHRRRQGQPGWHRHERLRRRADRAGHGARRGPRASSASTTPSTTAPRRRTAGPPPRSPCASSATTSTRRRRCAPATRSSPRRSTPSFTPAPSRSG